MVSTAELDEATQRPQSAVPPVRRRGMFLGLLAAVFLSGGVVGGGVGMFVVQEQFSNCLRYPERMPRRILSMFESELGLSEEQSEKVSEIVQRHHQQIESLRQEVHPRIMAEFKAIHQEMSSVLNDAQRAKLDSLRDRMMKNLPVPSCDRGANQPASTDAKK